MSYAEYVRRLARANTLHRVTLELTYACNLDCVYCYNDRSTKGKPLSVGEYHRLLTDLTHMQVLHLVLSGGEPLVHPEFFAIARRARELGFVIRLKSNGYALRGSAARRLKEEVDPFQVDLSLHGATAATHDRQTRVRGSFDRLVANVRELRELGLSVAFTCTLTRWNEGEVEALYALADELGVVPVFGTSVSPTDGGDMAPLAISPSPTGIARLLRAQQARRTSNPEPGLPERRSERSWPTRGEAACGAGAITATVDPWGNVLPCVQWRRPVGNLREASIEEIWSGRPLAQVRSDAIRAADTVRELGPDGRLTNFCPGLAEIVTGCAWALYPTARAEMEARRALAEDTR